MNLNGFVICLLIGLILPFTVLSQTSKSRVKSNAACLAYKPLREKCCQGVIYRESTNAESSCCGNQLYYETEQICCVSELTPSEWKLQNLTFGVKSDCCGTNLYNVDKSLCTEDETLVHFGKNATKDFIRNAGLCDEKIYDTRKYVCCDSKMIPLKDKTEMFCCESTAFDPKESICCQGKVQSVRSYVPTAACCYGAAYDKTKQVCCNGKPMDRIKDSPDSTECCGGVLYDANKKLCCDEKLLTLNGSSSTVGCCNGKTYSYFNSVCCGGKVLPGNWTSSCCGGLKVYDVEKQICCNDKIYPFKSGVSCCGNQAYNADTDICCDRESNLDDLGADQGAANIMIIKKTSRDFEQCCSANTLPAEEVCYRTDEVGANDEYNPDDDNAAADNPKTNSINGKRKRASSK